MISNAFFNTILNISNTVKGYLRITKRGAEQNWMIIEVTGITDNGGSPGWYTIDCSWKAGTETNISTLYSNTSRSLYR